MLTTADKLEIILIYGETVQIELDGVEIHSTAEVREFLNNLFREKWIGKFSEFSWPPRFSDLNIMDFFWGYLKE
ncbi:hypothetical protein NQ318_021859 [Aromia moschata]|uniref:Uncharacterized protein n=1 Tax=Aromia moschata TaxID=1265417 RepID=A0AAV8Z8R4_9CUCU|nr:hypothetical protein NQ318_021859 [Aromia moschata]